jgi:hypothetical protein
MESEVYQQTCILHIVPTVHIERSSAEQCSLTEILAWEGLPLGDQRPVAILLANASADGRAASGRIAMPLIG